MTYTLPAPGQSLRRRTSVDASRLVSIHPEVYGGPGRRRHFERKNDERALMIASIAEAGDLLRGHRQRMRRKLRTFRSGTQAIIRYA